MTAVIHLLQAGSIRKADNMELAVVVVLVDHTWGSPLVSSGVMALVCRWLVG